MPSAATWMDPEIIILSKGIQNEKDKCYMVSLYAELKKITQMNLSAKYKETRRHREQTCGLLYTRHYFNIMNQVYSDKNT